MSDTDDYFCHTLLLLLIHRKINVRSGASCKIEVREDSSENEAKAETAQRKSNRLTLNEQKEKHRTVQLL